MVNMVCSGFDLKWRAIKMDIEEHHHKVSLTICQIDLSDILMVLL
jgi:hypothetical protein